MSDVTTVTAAELKPGDATVNYEILSVRKATPEEVRDLWPEGPRPEKVIAATVQWADRGLSDRYWAATEPIILIKREGE